MIKIEKLFFNFETLKDGFETLYRNIKYKMERYPT